MTFQKELQFLGMQKNDFQDGSCFYKVSFYDPEAGSTVVVNVVGNKADLVSSLQSLKFGALVLCEFALVEKDKLYRLVLRTALPLK